MKKIRLAYFDNTIAKKNVNKKLYAGGETDNRLVGLKEADVGNVIIDPIIIDPYPFPLNPFRNYHALFSGIDPLRALKVFLNYKKYDAIFCVGESSALAFLFYKSLFKIKIPVLVLDPALSLGWRPRKKILDFVIPRADKIIVFGKNQKKFIYNQWGEKCESEFVYHGINSNFYKPLKIQSEEFIFSIGNDNGRDFKLLIESCENINVKIKIKTNLTVLDDLYLNKNVEVIKGRISFDEMKTMYAKSKIVVIPLFNCDHASGVNSVLEAMSMGKALIVSRSEGISDYVINNKNAIVVEPGNKEQLKKTIIELLKKPDDIKRLGYNARKFIEENCDSKIYNKNLAKIISSVIN